MKNVILKILIYGAMLALVMIFYSGNGVFIYEGM